MWLQDFDDLNAYMQSDSGRIHLVKLKVEMFFKKLLIKFLKPSALNKWVLQLWGLFKQPPKLRCKGMRCNVALHYYSTLYGICDIARS